LAARTLGRLQKMCLAKGCAYKLESMLFLMNPVCFFYFLLFPLISAYFRSCLIISAYFRLFPFISTYLRLFPLARMGQEEP